MPHDPQLDGHGDLLLEELLVTLRAGLMNAATTATRNCKAASRTIASTVVTVQSPRNGRPGATSVSSDSAGFARTSMALTTASTRSFEM